MSVRRPGITTLIGDEPRQDEKQLYLAAIAAFGLIAGSDPLRVTQRASGRLGQERPSERVVRAFSWDLLFQRVESPRLRARLVSDLVRAHPTGFPWSERELGLIKLTSLAWSVPLPELGGVDWELVPTPARSQLHAARRPAPPPVRKPGRPVKGAFLRMGLATQAALACIAIGLVVGWLG